MTSQLKLICAAVALASAAPVFGTTTWTLNAPGTAAAGSNYAAATATSTGYANTSGTGGAVDSYTLQVQQGVSNTILYSGGIGINNRDGCVNTTTFTCSSDKDLGDVQTTAPEHAIDNDQRYEMVLVSFSTPVALTSVTSGWTGTDADITVLGYSGTPGTAPTFANGWKTSVTVTNGWTFVQNTSLASNVNSPSSPTTALLTNTPYSSYWLIGAFNPLVSTNFSGGIVGDGTPDYFKLLKLAGCVQGATGGAGAGCGIVSPPPGTVPEPATLILVAVGALGLAVRRQRR